MGGCVVSIAESWLVEERACFDRVIAWDGCTAGAGTGQDNKVAGFESSTN
jgi:hypothetical protein